MRTARPGHDELRKLIWPNTVRKNPALAGRVPSLEESMESGAYLVGTAEAVRDELEGLRDEIGLEYLTIFPHLPRMTQQDTLEQLERFQTEIVPALAGSTAAAPAGMKR
jgi:hypothetical protein